jgi:hypothetical protein
LRSSSSTAHAVSASAGGQVLVIGASEAGLTKLGEVSAKELPEADVASGAPPFGDVLARVLGTGSAGRSQGAHGAKDAQDAKDAHDAPPEEPR